MNVYYQGYLRANGEIICLLDSDDFFKRNKILNVSKFFTNFPEKIFYFDLPIIIDNRGSKYKKKIFFFKKLLVKFTANQLHFIEKKIF